jgi:hypothetical protein
MLVVTKAGLAKVSVKKGGTVKRKAFHPLLTIQLMDVFIGMEGFFHCIKFISLKL